MKLRDEIKRLEEALKSATHLHERVGLESRLQELKVLSFIKEDEERKRRLLRKLR